MRIPFSYIWRSLWARRLTTTLTLGGVALVVFVFAGVLMLARGLEATLVDTGSPENAIVLRRSAGSELVSQIDRGTASVLETQPEVAPAKDGRPLLSREGVVVINLYKKTTNGMSNVVVRGVSPQAFELRPGFRVTQGRPFQFGTHEIVVGKNIADRFKGVAVGAELSFGGDRWTAVASRVVEVGTLRALGFQRRSVLTAFLVESVLLATAGGAAGVGLASLLSFARVSTLNFGSFSEIGFGFALSPGVITSALIFAVVMGVVGGFLPAVRAARLNIVNALRAS